MLLSCVSMLASMTSFHGPVGIARAPWGPNETTGGVAQRWEAAERAQCLGCRGGPQLFPSGWLDDMIVDSMSMYYGYSSRIRIARNYQEHLRWSTFHMFPNLKLQNYKMEPRWFRVGRHFDIVLLGTCGVFWAGFMFSRWFLQCRRPNTRRIIPLKWWESLVYKSAKQCYPGLHITYLFIYLNIYIYIYIYVCVCVRACVCAYMCIHLFFYMYT